MKKYSIFILIVLSFLIVVNCKSQEVLLKNNGLTTELYHLHEILRFNDENIMNKNKEYIRHEYCYNNDTFKDIYVSKLLLQVKKEYPDVKKWKDVFIKMSIAKECIIFYGIPDEI